MLQWNAEEISTTLNKGFIAKNVKLVTETIYSSMHTREFAFLLAYWIDRNNRKTNSNVEITANECILTILGAREIKPSSPVFLKTLCSIFRGNEKFDSKSDIATRPAETKRMNSIPSVEHVLDDIQRLVQPKTCAALLFN